MEWAKIVLLIASGVVIPLLALRESKKAAIAAQQANEAATRSVKKLDILLPRKAELIEEIMDSTMELSEAVEQIPNNKEKLMSNAMKAGMTDLECLGGYLRLLDERRIKLNDLIMSRMFYLGKEELQCLFEVVKKIEGLTNLREGEFEKMNFEDYMERWRKDLAEQMTKLHLIVRRTMGIENELLSRALGQKLSGIKNRNNDARERESI